MNKLKKIVASAKGTEKREKKALLTSELFLPEWYKNQYPDIALSGMDPLDHYLRFGDKAGRMPNPFFDPHYYRQRAKGAREPGVNALLHYATRGWKKGNTPSAKFSIKLYQEHYPEAAVEDVEPLHYHLTCGQYKGNITFPVSLERPSAGTAAIDMKTINESGLFNPDWYRHYYTDLWFSDMDPLLHFVLHGWHENRQPNVVFDVQWYKRKYNPHLNGMNPLVFYITKGAALGHDPAPNFCVKTYSQITENFDGGTQEALAHYLKIGATTGKELPKRIKTNDILPVSDDLRGLTKFARTDLAPTQDTFDPCAMNIHWVIPDFAAGGGGHMTIFRMIHFLEVAGHKQTIWVNNPSLHKTPQAAYETILKYFQHFAGDVKFIDDGFKHAEGDALIATDCWTVYPALSATKFLRRFYFVQDYEPSFHPMGASYLMAEQTYKEDLDCICAGPWLSELMHDKYGRWARHFWLAADTRIYHPPKDKPHNKVPRIAVYARHFTERRAVALAFLALEELANSGTKFVVDFFGAPLDFTSAPFQFIDHGIADAKQLAAIFQQADVGLVFSATNYSLVPQEMMASGLPIVELDGDSTRAIFPDNTVMLAKPHPHAVTHALKALLTSREAREKQADAASVWVKQFSWPDSAALVESALIERLSEFAQPKTQKTAPAPIKASVVIPTYNAGDSFEAVLSAVMRQRAPWPFEVLVIDSGSADSTLDILSRYPSVKVHHIDSKDFNHGGTRNLGVALTSGEFIAFLTHDAMPFNERWLHNIVTAIEHYPNAGGAFGKHLPWPEASPFTKRDLGAHFEQFNAHPISVSKITDKDRYDQAVPTWRQMLHFYSDNNSCMRRSVWEKIPYREAAFGEDQLWADDIIKAGFEKVYAPQAIVFHSHDYNAEETYERCKTESAFFKHFFGYELIKDEKQLEKTLKDINERDQQWAKENNVDDATTSRRFDLNEAQLKGYLAGCEADTSEMF